MLFGPVVLKEDDFKEQSTVVDENREKLGFRCRRKTSAFRGAVVQSAKKMISKGKMIQIQMDDIWHSHYSVYNCSPTVGRHGWKGDSKIAICHQIQRIKQESQRASRRLD